MTGLRWAVPLALFFLALPSAFAGVKIHYSEDVKQQAALIAAEATPKLAALHLAFLTQRQALPSPPPPEAVKSLLDQTEAALLEALNDPALAAMRDHVRVRFEEARADLERAKRSDRTAPGGVALAAFHRAQESDGSDASALDEVEHLVARVWELFKENDLIVNLCVTSKPKLGARFSMEPESYAKGGKEALTAGEIVNAYRGRYIYSAKLARKRIECPPKRERAAQDSCRALDLVDDSRPLLICDFEAGLCHRSEGALPAECQSHGQ